jgi:hypothetical protein
MNLAQQLHNLVVLHSNNSRPIEFIVLANDGEVWDVGKVRAFSLFFPIRLSFDGS